MGTERRNRQKEQHTLRQESVRTELKRQQRRRTLIGSFGAGALVLLLIVAGWALFGGGDDTTTTAASSANDDAGEPTDSEPDLSEPETDPTQPTSDAPCPPEGGTDERVTSFDGPPRECIDPSKQYSATFVTSEGSFTASLDAEAAPGTVNNFVVLARSHFYDGIPFHRVVPDFVIQAGDPTDTDDLTQLGAGGPGYTIAEEPPADGTYGAYDLAMAKTQEPNSTGSQFFVVTGDPSPLNAGPTYSLFGTVTDGTDVVDAIGNAPVGGPNGDTPEQAVTIESIEISEK